MSRAKPRSDVHKMQYEILRENIKFYRNRKGLTQAQLAELANISQAHIAAIEAENVKRSLSLETLFCIADALEIEAYRLFKHIE